MSSRRFDTLGTARDLEATGIERGQAETVAQAIERHGEQLATRDDIKRLEAEIATKFHLERLEASIAALPDRAELYRALWIQGAGIVAILATLEFLP